MNDAMVYIGDECRRARKNKGLSLRDMEKITIYNKSRLSRFENGKFDEDIFLYYFPFWEEYNFFYCMEEVPERMMKKIEDLPAWLANKPQYCIYNREKEALYMKLTDHRCFDDFYEQKQLVHRISEKIKKNEFKR